MKELNIQIIYANSPQAKGRIERVNRTLQDRLVKALRRESICNIAEANKYVQKRFMSEYNSRFAVNLGVPDAHRITTDYDLKNIFCYKTLRQVRNDYTINLAGEYVQLLKGLSPLPIPKQNVTICKWLNGEMHIYFNGQEIKFNHLKEKPGKKGYKLRAVTKNHPWRRWNQKIKDDKQRNYFAVVLG